MRLGSHASALTILLAGFLVGQASLTHQIYGIRVLFFFFSESISSVSLGVGLFILGIAVGSGLASLTPADFRFRHHVLITISLLSTALGCTVYPHLLTLDIYSEASFIKWVLPATLLFIPGVLHGACFPLLLDLYFKDRSVSSRGGGVLYAFDTLGAVSGCLITGMLLMPNYGITAAMAFAALSNACVALLLLRWPRWLYLTPIVCYCGLFLYAETLAVGVPATSNEMTYFGKILYEQQTDFGTVRVGQNPLGYYGRTLFIDRRPMCSTQETALYENYAQKISAYLPKDAEILILGLGCGFLAHAIVEFSPDAAIDIYEINPAVVEAARRHFGDQADFLKHNNVHLYVQDGRDSLNSGKTYDAIIIDIEEPSVIHASPLFTAESMKRAAEKLRPDGIFTIWSVAAGPSFNTILYNTVHSVFDAVRAERISVFIALFAHKNARMQPSTLSKELEQGRETRVNSLEHNYLSDAYRTYWDRMNNHHLPEQAIKTP